MVGDVIEVCRAEVLRKVSTVRSVAGRVPSTTRCRTDLFALAASLETEVSRWRRQAS